jgi:hypothetical protein
VKKPIAAVLVAIASAGCASGPVEVSERLDRAFVTGSSLPKRSHSTREPGLETLSREDLQRQRDLSTAQPTPLPPQPPGGSR